MTYATEFPQWLGNPYCVEMAKRAEADSWEDTSWYNDVSPSFTCDVFVLWIDHPNHAVREYSNGAEFVMICEGETMLETDSWGDVLAFMDDGKRDFIDYRFRDTIESLTAEFARWTASRGIIPDDGDALELLMDDRPQAQRDWLTSFVQRWDAVA